MSGFCFPNLKNLANHNFFIFRCLPLAYLKKAKKDVNLIAVNWESVSRTPNYVAAAHYVEPIGIHVASLIDFLVSKDMVALNDIQVIGFSLGAHIAGVGKFDFQTIHR